jgi:segregation and condensation protein A
MSIRLHTSDLGSAYAVTLPVFAGPLDLLLQLIEKNELEISAVSLVAVTDQYLKTIEALEAVDPGALADFLVVASRLLYIKSRSLLPQPRPAGEEDGGDEEDSADALVRQLLEYRQFKEIAAQLRQREEAGLRVYVRAAPPPELEKKLDMGGVTLEALHAALQRVLARVPEQHAVPRLRAYTITVAEQIEAVRALLRAAQVGGDGAASDAPPAQPVRFTALLRLGGTRLEVVVTFLAVLELIMQQEITAVQEGTFGEIVLMPVGAGGQDDTVPL